MWGCFQWTFCFICKTQDRRPATLDQSQRRFIQRLPEVHFLKMLLPHVRSKVEARRLRWLHGWMYDMVMHLYIGYSISTTTQLYYVCSIYDSIHAPYSPVFLSFYDFIVDAEHDLRNCRSWGQYSWGSCRDTWAPGAWNCSPRFKGHCQENPASDELFVATYEFGLSCQFGITPGREFSQGLVPRIEVFASSGKGFNCQLTGLLDLKRSCKRTRILLRSIHKCLGPTLLKLHCRSVFKSIFQRVRKHAPRNSKRIVAAAWDNQRYKMAKRSDSLTAPQG